MNREQQDLLIPLINLWNLPAKQAVFSQGDIASHLYILENGIVDIEFKPGNDPAMPVCRLTNTGIFGWSSVLGRKGYTSSAVAVTECEGYRFVGRELRLLCEDQSDLGVVILDRLASAIAERPEAAHGKVVNMLFQGLNLNCDH